MHIRPAAGEFRFVEQYRPPRSPQLYMLLAVVLGVGFGGILCLGGYAVAADKGVTYEQGRADRQALESWFAGLAGDFRVGADFWAEHRSARKPPAVLLGQGRSRQFVEGCAAAKARFDPADIRRKAERDYRDGWNSPLSSPSPSATPAPNYRINPDRLIPSPKPSGRHRSAAWLTYWPVIAGVIGVAAVLGWLGLNLPGARRVKMAWGMGLAPVWPALSRMSPRDPPPPRQDLDLEPIAAAVFEIVRQTVPGQSCVWSASYTAEAISLLIAALLTIAAMPGIIGMFFKPVTWHTVGWTFRMVWPNLYQFGRIGFSAFVCYLFQFGWLDRFDPLGHFQVAILSAGEAGRGAAHRRPLAADARSAQARWHYGW